MKLKLLCFSIAFCSYSALAAEWQPLLDKNLSQWDTYLSYKHKESYDGTVPKDEQGKPVKGASKTWPIEASATFFFSPILSLYGGRSRKRTSRNCSSISPALF